LVGDSVRKERAATGITDIAMNVDAVNGVHTPNPQPSMKILEEELPAFWSGNGRGE
jgi:hypothetical protein